MDSLSNTENELTPTSSVLLFAPTKPDQYSFGADTFTDLKTLKRALTTQNLYPVVVYFDRNQNDQKLVSELQALRKLLARSNILVISNRRSGPLLIDLKNKGLLNAILATDQEPQLSLQIQSLLADYAEFEQNELVLSLYHEQNRKLERLNLELEDRVDKRQKYLLKAQKKLQSNREKISLLHQGLLSIFRGDSILNIENFLFDVLKTPLKLEWLRIRFSDQSFLTNSHAELDKQNYNLTEIPLQSDGPTSSHLLLKKELGKFSEEEMDLLIQLSETLGLAISRIVKRQDAENLKQQWESTFDAISAPLCLTDGKLQVLRTNRTFNIVAGIPVSKILGQPALASLLGADAPQLENVLLQSKSGKIEATKSSKAGEKFFEVSLHPISSTADDDESEFMILFKDITEQKRMERQLLETSKMAELGIIGSSIAHELNNPIAGMTSFLQLIKMDLKPEDLIWEDVQEMENAARRCKEIIENLLGFARKQESEEEPVDLQEVILQAVKISELQTRAKGLTVELPEMVNPMLIKGNFNQLTQAIQNILKNALEACMEKSEQDSKFRPRIGCKIIEENEEISVLISDNGAGIPKEIQSKIFNPLFTTKGSGLASGLGLTVAFKIITEHKGKLEIASRLGRGTTARIAFQRPDL